MFRQGIATACVVALLSAGSSRAQDAGGATVTPEQADLALDLQRANLRKAEADAEAAENTTRAGRIPALPAAGAMTAGDTAGAAEALALSAVQLRQAAVRIVSDLHGSGFDPIYVEAGTSLPSDAELLAFRLRTEALEPQLRTAAGFDISIASDQNLFADSNKIGPFTFVGAAQIATAVLGAFQTDYRANGAPLTAPSDQGLITALLWAGAPALTVLDTGRVSTDAVSFIRTRLETLHNRRGDLEENNVTCRTLTALIDAAEKDDKPGLRAAKAEALTHCLQVSAAVTAYDDFLKTYGAADGEALLAVMRQWDVEDRLKGSATLLLVHVEGAAAGSYTQSNVFSTLGAMPFHVAAASVVSWRLVRGNGVVLSAGWEPFYSGYQQVTEVDRLLNGTNRVSERRHRRIIGRPADTDDRLPDPPPWIQCLREGGAFSEGDNPVCTKTGVEDGRDTQTATPDPQ